MVRRARPIDVERRYERLRGARGAVADRPDPRVARVVAGVVPDHVEDAALDRYVREELVALIGRVVGGIDQRRRRGSSGRTVEPDEVDAALAARPGRDGAERRAGRRLRAGDGRLVGDVEPLVIGRRLLVGRHPRRRPVPGEGVAGLAGAGSVAAIAGAAARDEAIDVGPANRAGDDSRRAERRAAIGRLGVHDRLECLVALVERRVERDVHVAVRGDPDLGKLNVVDVGGDKRSGREADAVIRRAVEVDV